jgi:hypothetical protein
MGFQWNASFFSRKGIYPAFVFSKSQNIVECLLLKRETIAAASIFSKLKALTCQASRLN